MRLSLLSSLTSLLVGCSTSTPAPLTVPNLHQVRPGLWRSAQPSTPEHWSQLKGLGVTRIIKLNFESEGSDDGARSAGLTVYTVSIQPAGDADIFDAVANTFVTPDPARLAEAQAVIRLGGGVLVHCTHGWDRTGFVIGQSRVLDDHWSKSQAYQEMIQNGFHSLLRGLHEAWEHWEPSTK